MRLRAEALAARDGRGRVAGSGFAVRDGFAVGGGGVLLRRGWGRRGMGWRGLPRLGLDWLPCEGIPLVAYCERLCGGYGSLSSLLDSRSHGLFVGTRTLENKDEEEGVVNWKLLPTGVVPSIPKCQPRQHTKFVSLMAGQFSARFVLSRPRFRGLVSFVPRRIRVATVLEAPKIGEV